MLSYSNAAGAGSVSAVGRLAVGLGARVWADGAAVGETPVGRLELEAGRHEIRLTTERYKPATRTVDIEGMGNQQFVEVTLQQGWGTLLVARERWP